MRTSVSTPASWLLTLAFSLAIAPQASFANLTDQGYTGYINIPTADVTPEGAFQFFWNDAVPSGAEFRNFVQADSYAVSIGMFPALEFGARLINVGDEGFNADTNTFLSRTQGIRGARDLSTNVKLRLWNRGPWPRVAVGIQDASGNGKFTASYGVATYRYGRVEGSVGYGSQRLGGIFYGARVDILPFLRVLYDDDTVQQAAALEIDSGEVVPGFRFFGRYRAHVSGPQPGPTVSLGMQADLGKARRWQRLMGGNTTLAPLALGPERTQQLLEAGRAQGCERALLGELKQAGLDRAHVSSIAVEGRSALMVAVDARRFPYSPVDGAGVALFLAAHTCAEDFRERPIIVQIAEDGLSKFWVSSVAGDVVTYAGYRSDAPPALEFGWGRHEQFERLGKRDGLAADVFIAPALRYTLATELGVLDYSIGVQAVGQVPLWRGAVAVIEGVDDVAKSFDFESRQPLASFGLESKVLNTTVQQTLPLWGYGAVRLHYGRSETFATPTDVRLAEVVLLPIPETGLQLESRFSSYRRRDSSRSGLQALPENPEAWTGSLRYSFGTLDALVDATWGRYHFDDEGLRLRVGRAFGDSIISLVYLRDKDKDNEALALRMSLPFGQQQTASLGDHLAVGTLPYWATTMQTTINSRSNSLRPNLLRENLPADTLSESYFSRSRLNRAYMQSNWPRMRDAFEQVVLAD
ncbi:MAG: YjbH domain-containing protein [Oceanococcaceae bacterium]